MLLLIKKYFFVFIYSSFFLKASWLSITFKINVSLQGNIFDLYSDSMGILMLLSLTNGLSEFND